MHLLQLTLPTRTTSHALTSKHTLDVIHDDWKVKSGACEDRETSRRQ